MEEYVLDHHLSGEGERLALMSRLLDPMHRRHLEALGVGPGMRALEVGCGNGSISAWLAGLVGRDGRVVAVDLDLSLVAVRAPALELREGDILAGPVEPGGFDLVTARAVIHHLAADADTALANLVASLRPGGAILLIEPDFLPVSVAEPAPVRAFWQGWLAWAREQGIDYHIGRGLAPRLAALGVEQIAGAAESAVHNGGSDWGDYWARTIVELRDRLVASRKIDPSSSRRSSPTAPIQRGGRRRPRTRPCTDGSRPSPGRASPRALGRRSYSGVRNVAGANGRGGPARRDASRPPPRTGATRSCPGPRP